MTQKTCIHDRDRKHRQVYIDRWTGTGKGNVDRDRGQVYRWTGTGACNVDIPSFGSMGSGASVVSKRAHYICRELPAMAAAMRSNAAPMATAGPSTTAGPSNATLMATAGPSNAAPVFPPHPPTRFTRLTNWQVAPPTPPSQPITPTEIDSPDWFVFEEPPSYMSASSRSSSPTIWPDGSDI